MTFNLNYIYKDAIVAFLCIVRYTPSSTSAMQCIDAEQKKKDCSNVISIHQAHPERNEQRRRKKRGG